MAAAGAGIPAPPVPHLAHGVALGHVHLSVVSLRRLSGDIDDRSMGMRGGTHLAHGVALGHVHPAPVRHQLLPGPARRRSRDPHADTRAHTQRTDAHAHAHSHNTHTTHTTQTIHTQTTHTHTKHTRAHTHTTHTHGEQQGTAARPRRFAYSIDLSARPGSARPIPARLGPAQPGPARSGPIWSSLGRPEISWGVTSRDCSSNDDGGGGGGSSSSSSSDLGRAERGEGRGGGHSPCPSMPRRPGGGPK